MRRRGQWATSPYAVAVECAALGVLGEILSMAGNGRSSIPDALDVYSEDALAPFFDCRPVVTVVSDVDCDGRSDSYALWPGTMFYRDRENYPDAHAVMPLTPEMAAWPWADYMLASDGYLYVTDNHWNPWVYDDTLGTVLDHSMEDYSFAD